MKSKVFFIPVDGQEPLPRIQEKFGRLLHESACCDFARAGRSIVIKIHFGEEGNVGFVSPDYVRVLVEQIKKRGGEAVLSDTNTLYRGRRTNARDHLKIAEEHGFSESRTGARVVIPEDSPQTTREIFLQQKWIKTAKVSKMFVEADGLLNVSHFKGHLMTGFGGALKNIGMGCATREGKLAQHSDVSPVVYKENCVACGACVAVCPVDAIKIIEEKAVIEGEKCIGCASCIAACRYNAMEVDWDAGGHNIQEKMVEYAKAVLDNRRGPTAHIDFALKITKECDCLAKDDPRICPDLGIFISTDPVSVDKACYDSLIEACGKDVFKIEHPRRDGMKQLEYAHQLGLGNMEYELVRS